MPLSLFLTRNKAARQAAAQAVVQYAYEHGLILMACGTHGNVLRFLVPLTINDEELEEGLAVVEGALANLTKIMRPVLSINSVKQYKSGNEKGS